MGCLSWGCRPSDGKNVNGLKQECSGQLVTGFNHNAFFLLVCLLFQFFMVLDGALVVPPDHNLTKQNLLDPSERAPISLVSLGKFRPCSDKFELWRYDEYSHRAKVTVGKLPVFLHSRIHVVNFLQTEFIHIRGYVHQSSDPSLALHERGEFRLCCWMMLMHKVWLASSRYGSSQVTPNPSLV